jgi:hypothetical protein
MAEVIPAWANREDQQAAPSWANADPETVEDIAKTVVPGLKRGAVMLGTTLPSVADLAMHGVQAGANLAGYPNVAEAIQPQRDYLAPATYGPALKTMQEKGVPSLGIAPFGDLYQPTTPGGKLTNAVAEVAPSLAVGNLKNLGERAVRGTIGALSSEGASQGAHAILPAGLADKYDAMIRLLGGGAGLVGPRSTAQAAQDAKVLKDSGVRLTAGEATGSPYLKRIEESIGGGPNKEERFTAAATRESGMPAGPINPANVAAAKAESDAFFNRIRGTDITTPNFNQFLKEAKAARDTAYKGVGAKGIDPFDQYLLETKQGLSGVAGGQPALNMTGQRYQTMREQLQDKINSAGTGVERNAWSDIRKALDNAMAKEMPDINLADKYKRYANFKSLENTEADAKGLISPKSVKDNMDTGAYNRGQGLAPLAQASERAFAAAPEKSGVSRITSAQKLIGALGGAAGGLHYGGDAPIVGAILGHEIMPHITNLLSPPKAIAQGAYHNPLTQSMIKALTTERNPALSASILGRESLPVANQNQ